MSVRSQEHFSGHGFFFFLDSGTVLNLNSMQGRVAMKNLLP